MSGKTAIIVTGNLCSGKNLFAKLVSSKGYVSVDSDQIVKTIIKARVKQLLKKLGLDQRVIKSILASGKTKSVLRKIGQIVFTNRKLLSKWEKILHPMVYIELRNRVINHSGRKPLILLIPLFFESQTHVKFKRVVVLIYSHRAECLNRARLKGINLPEERLIRQKKFEEVLDQPDCIIFNISNLQHLRIAAKLFTLFEESNHFRFEKTINSCT